MSEFRYGIFKLLAKILGGNSVMLAVVYTVGHIAIAMACNRIITGADAIIEPCINGVWFYILHNTWRKHNETKSS